MARFCLRTYTFSVESEKSLCFCDSFSLLRRETVMKCLFALNPKGQTVPLLCAAALSIIGATVLGCSGGPTMSTSGSTGTVNVSISDPPSCKNPNGNFAHVYITVRSVQAHTSASAADSTPGWQELAPQLNSAPMQIDLFSTPQTTCILAQLGSASLPVGSYQQLRLLLVSNSPAASDTVPATNACAGQGYNCVVVGGSHGVPVCEDKYLQHASNLVGGRNRKCLLAISRMACSVQDFDHVWARGEDSCGDHHVLRSMRPLGHSLRPSFRPFSMELLAHFSMVRNL
jgi:hypothetical protein